MPSGAKLSPLRAPADLERADAVCPLSSRQGVLQGMWDLIRGSTRINPARPTILGTAVVQQWMQH